MADDGSGNFTRLYSWVTDAANNIKILASRMDAEMNGMATALTNRLNRDSAGGGGMERDLPMGNNKLTSLGAGTALTDSVNLDQIQSGTIQFFGTTGGTSTVYTLAPSPSINAYDTGMFFLFKVNADSGASPTINISAKGAKNMKKYNNITGAKVAITALDLQTSVFYLGLYDGTDVVVLNPGKLDVLSIDKTLNFDSVSSTVSSGVLPYTAVFQEMVGEGAVADTITDISGGSSGDFVVLSNSKGYDIDITHNGSKINLAQGLNIRTQNGDKIGLLCIGSNIWVELFRSLGDGFRSGSGYFYLPNNRLFQFGTNTAATVTFGIAYDATPVVVGIDTADTSGGRILSIHTITTSQFAQNSKDFDGNAYTANSQWIAIGTKAQ